jgi:N,N-dimethylformamidase beta subunit-like protein
LVRNLSLAVIQCLVLFAGMITFSSCGHRSAPEAPGVVSSSVPPTPSGNRILIENSHPGTTDWQLTNLATHGEIEGFASSVSVQPGEAISFFVNTSEPTYNIEIFRMGWYGGMGGRRMTTPLTGQGVVQTLPSADPDTLLVECVWTDPLVIPVPTTWVSGVYLAKLTSGTTGKQRYVIFVVRDDNGRSDLLFQLSVTTYQAYNRWGGFWLYSTPRAYKVSFNRPYEDGHGAAHFLSWEYDMLRFLEREGYDVSYSTDVDTHRRGDLLLNHRAFLSVGHDEYWSWDMRANVERARDRGVSLGFFGANASYWQIRLEPSGVTGNLDRTIVCYKDAFAQDPVYGVPILRFLTTTRFRSPIVNKPEDAMIGVMYDWGPVNSDMVIQDASNWVFAGTGLHNGDHLAGLLGYEVDRMFGNAPANTISIAHSPYTAHNEVRYSDMTVYTASSGSTVVATGSMQWNWGLDGYGPGQPSPAVQQATRNILNEFVNGLGTP